MITVLLSWTAALWGGGALLGYVLRLGLLPVLSAGAPVIAKVADLALELFAGLMRWLGGALVDQFEKGSRIVVMALCFYAGAWHFAGWRPWHGFTKQATIARAAAPAPKVAPKFAPRAAKRQNTDAFSDFVKTINPF